MVLDRDRVAANEVRRAWKDLKRRNATSQRCLETRVLRPYRVNRIDVRRRWARGLIAVGVSCRVWSRVDAEV